MSHMTLEVAGVCWSSWEVYALADPGFYLSRDVVVVAWRLRHVSILL